MNTEVSLEKQKDQKTGKWAPSLKVQDMDIMIDPDKVSIRLEGSFVAKIAEMFTNLFKKVILSQVIENTKQET